MLRNWLVLGIGLVGSTFAVAGVFAWASRPETYRDAVSEAFDQRQVTYTDIEVREICIPDPHCIVGDGMRSFSTIVIARVTVQGEEMSHGQVTCYDRRGDCYLDLPTLGFQRQPLRDLRGVRMLPMPLARVWEFGAAWLRGRLRPTPGT